MSQELADACDQEIEIVEVATAMVKICEILTEVYQAGVCQGAKNEAMIHDYQKKKGWIK